MKIRKILCGILAGVLICTGNPVISQGKVQAQLQVVRSKTMTVTLEASGGKDGKEGICSRNCHSSVRQKWF